MKARLEARISFEIQASLQREKARKETNEEEEQNTTQKVVAKLKTPFLQHRTHARSRNIHLLTPKDIRLDLIRTRRLYSNMKSKYKKHIKNNRIQVLFNKITELFKVFSDMKILGIATDGDPASYEGSIIYDR